MLEPDPVPPAAVAVCPNAFPLDVPPPNTPPPPALDPPNKGLFSLLDGAGVAPKSPPPDAGVVLPKRLVPGLAPVDADGELPPKKRVLPPVVPVVLLEPNRGADVPGVVPLDVFGVPNDQPG